MIEIDLNTSILQPTRQRQQQGTTVSPEIYIAAWNFVAQLLEDSHSSLELQLENEGIATPSMPGLPAQVEPGVG